MSLNKQILTEIEIQLKSFNIPENYIEVAMPRIEEHGDFSLNLAFKCAKLFKKAPKAIAKELCEKINQSKLLKAEDLNGYVNLKLNDDFLSEYFYTFLNKSIKHFSDEKILLEYVSANPTGPLHIGHGRWAAFGDSLYRLLKSVGADVSNEFYINDAGNQIKVFNQSIEAVRNNKPIPENGYGGFFIKHLINNKDENQTNIKFVINYQKNTLKKLNCSFDNWFSESTLHHDDILSIIKNSFNEYIYEKDNAIWFATTRFNDDKDRVIQKENGDLTYFAADILYHLTKINRGFSRIINIWGADHHGYVERIRSILLAQENPIKFDVILGQLVHLYKDGEPVKMSKRTGELIELNEVINEIGSDATRYFLVEKKPELHLDFDLEKAKEKNMSNPVYYIQYAHARISNIIEKTNDDNLEINNDIPLNEKDRQLLLSGARFYDVLIESASTLDVHKIAHYLFELCQTFHSFYSSNHIIFDNKIHQKRLNLIINYQKIIKKAANILGISSPEKM